MDGGGDFERVLKRQKFVSLEASSTLDRLLTGLSTAKSLVLESGQVPQKESLTKLKDWAGKVLDSHKDFQSTLAKFSKNADKKYFKADLGAVWNPRALEGKTRTLNSALASHFIREGLFDLASVFEDEAGVALPQDFKDQFTDMFRIQAALKEGSLTLAIDWAQAHSKDLELRGSCLEFQLHRLRFIQLLLLTGGTAVQDCLAYARTHLAKFSKSHMAGGILFFAHWYTASQMQTFND
jgi:hypothetical protein